MTEARCENCRFWEQGGEGGDGLCVRYPPTIIDGAETQNGLWPVTYTNQWCGEHQPTPKDQKGDEG